MNINIKNNIAVTADIATNVNNHVSMNIGMYNDINADYVYSCVIMPFVCSSCIYR